MTEPNIFYSQSSDRPLERTASLRGKRLYGSVDGSSPLTPTGSVSVERSNSAVDPAAARRAAVR